VSESSLSLSLLLFFMSSFFMLYLIVVLINCHVFLLNAVLKNLTSTNPTTNHLNAIK
jgi:hypothetical protein